MGHGSRRRGAGVTFMPLAEEPLALIAAALRDPQVVLRYQAKMVTVPGSDCLWWRGAVSGRGHGRFYLGRVPDASDDVSGAGGEREDREVCVIAHRFGYALVRGRRRRMRSRCSGTAATTRCASGSGRDTSRRPLTRRTAAPIWRGGPWRPARWRTPGAPGAGRGSYVT